jgi:Tol biopolymer transport system component
VDTLETRKLTAPNSEHQDWGPSFSPDGTQLAFIRTNGALTMAEIFIMPAKGGEAHRLTFDNAIIPSPPTWTRDGKSIVFSSTRSSIPTLWRIPASGGTPVQVPQIGVVALHPSASANGHRLVYGQIFGRSSIWKIDLGKIGTKDSRTQVTASGGFNWSPEFSPDGRKIVFLSDRLGTMEIWTCKRDGSDLVQLTKLGSQKFAGPPHWSPDSQTIAFDSALGEHNAIFVIKAEGGFPRSLTNETSDNTLPSWSHDGRWIYFTSNRTGQWQVWRMPSQGGEPIQLTKQGGFGAFESSAGDYVYYAKTPSEADIWRLPAAGGPESPVSPRIHVHEWKDWALVDSGIFLRSERSQDPRAVLRFFDFATATLKNVTLFEKPGEWISASADGKFVLYHQEDHQESNIMMLENFQ